MAHNPNKPQRLSDFDFSSPEAHVAIVGKAANGKEKFLVTKKLNEKIEKQDFLVTFQDPAMDKVLEVASEMVEEAKEKAKGKPTLEMPLEEVFQVFFYMWEGDAKKIADAVIMKSSDSDKEVLRKALIERLMQSGSDPSGAAETSGNPDNVTKTKVENMSKEAPEQVDVQKAVDTATADLRAQNEVLSKSLEKLQAIEEARVLDKYTTVAKSLTVLGATEDQGKVLKAVAAIEGGEGVIAMLTKAAELVAKGESLKEVGTGASADADSKEAKLAGIAKSLAAEKGITFQAAMVMAADQNPQLVG